MSGEEHGSRTRSSGCTARRRRLIGEGERAHAAHVNKYAWTPPSRVALRRRGLAAPLTLQQASRQSPPQQLGTTRSAKRWVVAVVGERRLCARRVAIRVAMSGRETSARSQRLVVRCCGSPYSTQPVRLRLLSDWACLPTCPPGLRPAQRSLTRCVAPSADLRGGTPPAAGSAQQSTANPRAQNRASPGPEARSFGRTARTRPLSQRSAQPSPTTEPSAAVMLRGLSEASGLAGAGRVPAPPPRGAPLGAVALTPGRAVPAAGSWALGGGLRGLKRWQQLLPGQRAAQPAGFTSTSAAHEEAAAAAAAQPAAELVGARCRAPPASRPLCASARPACRPGDHRAARSASAARGAACALRATASGSLPAGCRVRTRAQPAAAAAQPPLAYPNLRRPAPPPPPPSHPRRRTSRSRTCPACCCS